MHFTLVVFKNIYILYCSFAKAKARDVSKEGREVSKELDQKHVIPAEFRVPVAPNMKLRRTLQVKRHSRVSGYNTLSCSLLAHFNPASGGKIDGVSDRSWPWDTKAGTWDL